MNLLQDKDFDGSVDGDFEEEMQKQFKRNVVERATQRQMDEGMECWFVCDAHDCLKPIKEGAFRFDCQQCDNFTFCERCYRKNTQHAHKFVKAKVPMGQGPPQNCEELISKAYMRCCECLQPLLDVNKRVYTCIDKKCSPDPEAGDALYWCKQCKEDKPHEHKLERVKGQAGFPFLQAHEDLTDAQKQ